VFLDFAKLKITKVTLYQLSYKGINLILNTSLFKIY